MRLKRFNEASTTTQLQKPNNNDDFLEEVITVFSFMKDQYNMNIFKSQLDKRINIIIEKDSGRERKFNNILDYISMLNELDECLRRLSINKPLYHTFFDHNEDMLIILDRIKFGDSTLIK